MGYSSWSNDQYTSYAKSTNLRSASRAEVFTSRKLSEKLDPKLITLRESRDSDFNPKSTPIIFALDLTGSLGYVAEAIAKDGLPNIMTRLYDEKPITDPHIMFIGFGDMRASDRAPLQMSQFEADIRIVEQLRDLYIEGGGGGNDSESVNLAWYAAAYLTETDANKRGERGFLFTFSDECVPPDITRHDLKKVFGEQRGDDMIVPKSTTELLSHVQSRYNAFHFIVEDGSYARTSYRGRSGELHNEWKAVLGPNVIHMKQHTDLPEIVIALLKIVNDGEDINDIVSENPMLQYAFKNALEHIV